MRMNTSDPAVHQEGVGTSDGVEITSTALLDCDCSLCAENLPKLNGLIAMGNIHGMAYDGEQFLYCPWCGEKRKQSNEKAEGLT